MPPAESLSHIHASAACCGSAWEQAYLRFETPAQEIAKFRARLRRLGAARWPPSSQIVELFCGRANGLHALAGLGFSRLEGVDLSANLLGQYRGSARLYVADCRALPFESDSRDVLVVQGGLHHLPRLPEDLRAVLDEARRVLRPGGRFVAVEPWNTSFLRFTHFLGRRRWLRRAWGKLDALAVMIENELETYANWLARPNEIQTLLRGAFRVETERVGWGKLMFVGVKTEDDAPPRPLA